MKSTLVGLLKEMSTLESHQFRSRAYYTASGIITEMSDEEFEKCEDFTCYYGIGSGINTKILQFKEQGKIDKLEELRLNTKDYLDPRLYKIRTSYITKRIPYADGLVYFTNINRLVKSMEPKLPIHLTLAGSMRRESELIADIDIMVFSRHYQELISILKDEYFCLSSGDYKSSFMIDDLNKVSVDVISYTEEDYSFQLLYLTGSKEHNIKMRGIAKYKGYSLNQYGIFDEHQDSVLKAEYEIDIFEFLGMEHVEPNKR